jgi:NADH-quinone oxidoreductase subunit M
VNNGINLTLTLLLLLPLAGAVIAMLVPERQVGSVAGVMMLLQIGFLLPVLLKYNVGGGLEAYVNELWIPQLGVHYALGLDGLNLFMVCLTVLAWTAATFSAAARELASPRLFFFLLALAEVGTLGAFMTQDLIMFVLFFDLLLIPLYLLIGIWGGESELGSSRRATATFMVYTLVGSFLMLAAAVALGLLSAERRQGGLSFLFSDLASAPVSHGAQNWIFVGFMLALLIKMPTPPLHGWMPITYRAAPLPVLIVLSAVVAKLGAYGFLRVVLPIMPDAANTFQVLLMVLALVAIIYGSVMAFSQNQLRLIIGYSSIAQLGFVLLGIFSLGAKGAEGAVLQMINHGLVVIGLLLIVGFLSIRVGSERLSEMGGLARNAPIFAALFLIVSLATLAMPGSPNFVGEVYILFGAFDAHLAWGAVATLGVMLAAVYTLRLFQRSMHNRGSAGDELTAERSRELSRDELALLLPSVLIVLALAIYPQFVVERVEPAAKSAAAAASSQSAPTKIAQPSRVEAPR